jgi:hypothetical protein
VPKKWGRFYHGLLKHRQRGDYEDLVVFKREDVEAWFRDAEVFIAQITKHVGEQVGRGAIENSKGEDPERASDESASDC